MPKVKRKSAKSRRIAAQEKRMKQKITLQDLQMALKPLDPVSKKDESDNESNVIENILEVPTWRDKGDAGCSSWSENRELPNAKAKQKALHEKEKYHLDDEFRQKVYQTQKRKYAESEEVRERKRQNSALQYAEPTQRERIKMASTNKYGKDSQFRQKVKSASVTKYATNEAHQQNVREGSKKMYSTNEPHRTKVRERSIKKYAINEAHQQKVKLASIKKYATNETHREKLKEISIKKYACYKTFRENMNKASKQKYASDKSLRLKKIQRVLAMRRNKEIKSKRMAAQRSYYVKKQATISNARRKRYYDEKNAKQGMNRIIDAFKLSCKEGPEFTCSVCHRLSFKKQVKKCFPEKLLANKGLTERCVTNKYVHICTNDCAKPCPRKKGPAGELYICHTCQSHLAKGTIPPCAQANALDVEDRPSDLKSMNSLEEQLVSLAIPFSKVVALPKGGQRGIKGGVICVPSNVTETTKVLPRPLTESELIAVKLKRKVEYTGYIEYKVIDTAKIQRVFNFLKENNPHYHDVEFDESWMTLSEEEVLSELLLVESTHDETNIASDLSAAHIENDDDDDDNGDGDGDYDDQELMKRAGFDSCMQPPDLRTEANAELHRAIFSIAPAQGNKPVSVFRPGDDDIEAKAFPTLFPTGQNTFQQDREKKISMTQYFNARLMGADIRFAENSQYIFFAQYSKELDQLLSGISIAMRKGATKAKDGTTVTAEMLVDDEQVAKLKKSDIAYHNFDTLRGTPDYWKRTMNDLFAMIRQLGLPTWFCTFSAAELSRWPEVIETIARQQGREVDFESLDWNEKCDILRSNPVTAARMFDHRVHEFVTNVLKSKEQPIGEITDYFYRVEYQSRGSPHIHCLFFVKDAPEFDKTDDATIADFVDRYISCQLPDEQMEPELHEIVKSVQTHRKKHSKSCKKGKKLCRFNFPRPLAKETFINRTANCEESDSTEEDKKLATACLKVLAEKLNGDVDLSSSIDEVIIDAGFSDYEEFQKALQLISTKAEIVMKRDVKDVWINGYNPLLLQAWNANMDIQYIMDPYSCVMYILSYISKSEHELGEILKAAQKQLSEKDVNSDLRGKMKKMGSVYFENREVSVQEAVARTCSLRLKESSRQVVFVATDRNARLSKPLNQIKEQADKPKDEQDIWMTSLEDRYKARPKSQDFESMCQATFASEYRCLSKGEAQRGKEKPHVFELQNNLGYIQKRTRGNNAVIRFAKYSPTENAEKYNQSLLKLYLPFRRDAQLKPVAYLTYQDFYEQGAVKVTQSSNAVPVKLIVERNRQDFEKTSEDLQNAWQQFHEMGVLEDAWAQIAPETEVQRREAETERDPEENNDALLPEEIPQLQNDKVNEPARTLLSVEWLGDSVRHLLQTMNQKQKEVFYYVREWCLKSVQGKEPEPFFLHVTGGAGTGKSHLIKCIYNEASKILKNQNDPEEVKVLLTAPTGTAAFNIGAYTIHSAFKISRAAKCIYESLSNESVNTLQSQLGGLKILIIDEISMVDRKVLAYIHGRLKQLKHMATSDKRSLFGGVCVLAVGDFYQLPPVKAKPVCIPDMQFGSDMWNDNFEIVSLDEIMRQKDDASFAQTLNVLRTKSKAQKLSTMDDNALQSRVDQANIPQDALHVFATNKAVDKHNAELLYKKCADPKIIEAQDYSKNARNGRTQRLPNPKKGISDDLPDYLQLGKGAHVMLLRNVDVSDGLVNGAFGSVVDFVHGDNETIKTVHVKFDSENVGKKRQLENKCVPIELHEDGLSNMKSIYRRQFPLKLAWACTIHKVQGMTVKELIYDMTGTFSCGQAYVALSRVTSLAGLFLTNYNPKLVYRSEPIHKALQQMTPFSATEQTSFVRRDFTIVHHNVQGLHSKMKDIQSNQDVTCSEVLAVTESWLTNKIEDEDIALTGFNVHRADRTGGRGGICVYTSDKMPARQVHFYSSLEHCALYVSPSKGISYLVITMYRTPKLELHNFVPRLQDLLHIVAEENVQDIVFVGDFNEDQLKEGRHTISGTFADYGFKQLITESTSRYGSMLDLIFIKTKHEQFSASVVPTYYSDHDAIRLSVQFEHK